MTFFVASISTLCCISVDRYYAVVKPVKYKNIFTIRKAHLMLAFCWLVALSCSSFPVIGWTKYRYDPGINLCSPQWQNHCGYYFFMTCIGFGIPVVILILTYWMIFAAIRKHERRFSSWNGLTPKSPRAPCGDIQKPVITVDAVPRDSMSVQDGMMQLSAKNLKGSIRGRSRSICSVETAPNSPRKDNEPVNFLRIPRHSDFKRQSSLLQFRALTQITTRLKSRTLTIPREYRIAKTGLGLFLVFFISWGPHMIVNNCSVDYITPPWASKLSIWFVYASCILNPVVYAFSSKHIRDAFRAALRCRRERRIADAFQMRRMSEATSTNHVG